MTVHYPLYVVRQKPCVPPWLKSEMFWKLNIDQCYFLDTIWWYFMTKIHDALPTLSTIMMDDPNLYSYFYSLTPQLIRLVDVNPSWHDSQNTFFPCYIICFICYSQAHFHSIFFVNRTYAFMWPVWSLSFKMLCGRINIRVEQLVPLNITQPLLSTQKINLFVVNPSIWNLTIFLEIGRAHVWTPVTL